MSDDHVNKISIEAIFDKPPLPFTYTPEILGVPTMGATGKGVKICFIDSGVPEHEAIINIADDANFAHTSSNRDFIGHSTVVSGLILGNKPGTLVGIAPDAIAYYAKVIDDESRTRLDAIVAAILWGVIKECDIICLPVSSPINSPSVYDAVRKANDSGILIVSCVGHSGIPAFPGEYEEVLSVGALNGQMKQAEYSEKGKVNMIASKMLSTYVEQNYAIVSGSSVATALACGVAARFVESRRELGAAVAPNILRSVMASALPQI